MLLALVSDSETQTNNDSSATVIPREMTQAIDTTKSEIAKASTKRLKDVSTISAEEIQTSTQSDLDTSPKTAGGK